MPVILQNAIPTEMHGDVRLPGMAPCGAQDWLRVDEAYGAQMTYREALLAQDLAAVLWMDETAAEAAGELLEQTLAVLPSHGFSVTGGRVHCPDGRVVQVDHAQPLATLGVLVQEDLCILQRRGAEHVLTGAVLCFPANWRLADKAGRALGGIHAPVDEYDANLAARVQRLFDMVRVGTPLWRFNRLAYGDPDLHQPYRKDSGAERPYVRSERQCIVRMPKTQAVVFSIHTYVVRRGAGQ